MKHRMRCSKKKCLHRFDLRKAPNLYKRRPRCPMCGGDKVYSIEASRRRQVAKERTHTCTSYPFPHRPGSLRMCVDHELFDVDPTAEELAEYEAIISTPRGSSC